jgi:SAM-dependent methyltransferase
MPNDSLRWREFVGRQLRSPEGVGGSMIGWLMTLANATPYELALRTLRLRPSDAVLELGFGPGAGLRRLAAGVPEGRICGVDHSATMVEAASRRNRDVVAEGRMELRCGKFHPLPWDDETFDKALLVNVVYFFEPSGDDAREVYRTLRRGGLVVAYATDRETMAKWPFVGGDTHRTFDLASLHEAFVDAGFEADDVRVERIALPFGVSGLLALARKQVPVKAATESG